MGYAYYVLADGREAGYGVGATCDEKDCSTSIDRGLGYLCGNTPGGDEWGCGGYFCSAHLFYLGVDALADEENVPQMCGRCADKATERVAGRTEVTG